MIIMRDLCFILMFCATALFSCQKAEFVSDSFIEDALEGVLITEGKDLWDGGIVPSKYFFLCDMIFYEDGTCRQCYRERIGDEIVELYHTFEWELDASNKIITLTDCKLLETSPDTAVGVLTIEKYKRRSYKLVGTSPSTNISGQKEREIYGRIGSAAERAEYEARFKNEDEFEE